MTICAKRDCVYPQWALGKKGTTSAAVGMRNAFPSTRRAIASRIKDAKTSRRKEKTTGTEKAEEWTEERNRYRIVANRLKTKNLVMWNPNEEA